MKFEFKSKFEIGQKIFCIMNENFCKYTESQCACGTHNCIMPPNYKVNELSILNIFLGGNLIYDRFICLNKETYLRYELSNKWIANANEDQIFLTIEEAEANLNNTKARLC